MRARTVSFIEFLSFYLREKLPSLAKRIADNGNLYLFIVRLLQPNCEPQECISRFDGGALRLSASSALRL